MASYLNRMNKRRRASTPAGLSGNIMVSSTADAVLDGVGTLLEIFPDPRPRTIRAFYCYRYPRAKSVKEAILADWAAIGQDMWKAIEAHAPEKSTEEAATRLKTLTAR
jgi:hypothetical protein